MTEITRDSILIAAQHHVDVLRSNGKHEMAEGLSIIIDRIAAHEAGIRDITDNK